MTISTSRPSSSSVACLADMVVMYMCPTGKEMNFNSKTKRKQRKRNFFNHGTSQQRKGGEFDTPSQRKEERMEGAGQLAIG